jgi:hypothetical protein
MPTPNELRPNELRLVEVRPDEVRPAVRPPVRVAGIKKGPAGIEKGQLDHRGEKIEYVFCRRRNFAIYRSGGKVMVHYAANDTIEKQQTAAVAELVPLRARLQFLMSSMKGEAFHYHCQIAEALRLGLDGQKDEGKALMKMLIDTIIERRLRQGRDWYLISTAVMVLAIIVLLCTAAHSNLWGLAPDEVAAGLRGLMLAAGSGAMGATMSTALALQARNSSAAEKTQDPRWNTIDGAARILIGVASAAALYLFLDSDFLGAIKIGDFVLKPDIDWKKALLVGFMAGFLERLVPDLLEKKFAVVTK